MVHRLYPDAEFRDLNGLTSMISVKDENFYFSFYFNNDDGELITISAGLE